MAKRILAIDGGGDGFRRAEIEGTKISGEAKTGPLSSVDELLEFIKAGTYTRIEGVSFAVAGEIEKHSIVVKSPNTHMLDGKSLPTLVMGKTGKPCIVGNDMECAVMGMAALLPKEKYFMGITWSSGIGLRFYQNGRIIAESEGGHVPLDLSPFAPRCGCGVQGCAESILGGMSLKRRVVSETTALGVRLPQDIDPNKFLDQAFRAQKPWAHDIYELIATGMASFLAGIVTSLRVPTIVWKGNFAKNALPLIENDIRRKMRKRLINPNWADVDNLKFLFSPDPENDGLIGAAKLFESLQK